MTYEAALAYIASLESRGWRLGLDRMVEFSRRAGLTDALGAVGGPQFIHVAGTNGKGSVTAFLQSLMVDAGYRTGAFFSPYVVDPRERVQFGREMIAPSELAALTQTLAEISEPMVDTEFGGLTEFEFKTALGFAYWKAQQAEWVALEVGLGGRLDSTNVVTPRASAIVSIGMDHMHLLGNTLAEIAREKAGIIKLGVPVVTGRMPEEALREISAIADDLGAPHWQYGRDYMAERRGGHWSLKLPGGDIDGVETGLVGDIQGHNAAVAAAAFRAAGAERGIDAVRRGLRFAYAPGRFEQRTFRGRQVIVDGAHNPDAATVLRQTLEKLYPGKRMALVTGMSRGHEAGPLYAELLHLVDRAYVTKVDFFRAVPPEDLVASLTALGVQAQAYGDVLAALHAAHEENPREVPILVTGSFYLAGDALRVLDDQVR